MVFYECIFIVRQDMSPAQVESLTEKFVTTIKEHKGKVERQEFCGLRTLAYPVRKNRKGHYVLLDVAAEPAVMKEIERQMRLNEDVLRYLTVRVDEHETGPSALMRASRSKDGPRREFFDEEEGGLALEESPASELESEEGAV